jgi:hypothetical protein
LIHKNKLNELRGLLKEAIEADKIDTNPPMRARNHDMFLALVEGGTCTWAELGIYDSEFEDLLVRMVTRCPEHHDKPTFLSWLVSDLRSRCDHIRRGISQQGSPMATVHVLKTKAA